MEPPHNLQFMPQALSQ